MTFDENTSIPFSGPFSPEIMSRKYFAYCAYFGLFSTDVLKLEKDDFVRAILEFEPPKTLSELALGAK